MSSYDAIKQKLAAHPVGAPDRPELDEILRLLFTPDEADLVQHLNFSPQAAKVIAELSGLPVNTVSEMCETMAGKGTLRSRDKQGVHTYALLELAPGLFEYPLMRGPREGLDYERLRDLWIQYYEAAWAKELHSVQPGASRVLPIGAAIEDKTTVVRFEQVSDFIDAARTIAVGKCACRIMAHRCDAPLETCLYLNSHGEFLIKIGLARQINKEEAMAVLLMAEKAGLVHVSSNSDEGGDIVCNCCTCCCVQMRTRTSYSGILPESAFRCQIAEEDCIACASCLDRCPTKSLSIVGDICVVEARNCLGCGLCASVCPTEAMSIVRRPDAAPSWSSMRDWANQALKQRNQAER